MGSNLEIVCKGVNVTWTFNGQNILSNVYYYRSSKVIIKKASVKHQGHYVCHGIDENQNEFFGVTRVSVLRKYS